jgi:phage terminase large subunit-like protein
MDLSSDQPAGGLRIKTARVFVPLLAPRRYKGAYGGRGSGKSQHFAGALVEECLAVPGTRAVCVREYQKSLKESAKRLIEDKIQQHGLGGHFEIQNDQIRTPGGGVIIFNGLQDHTAESIKSLEGFRIAWAEEAQSLTERSLELLRPTIRLPNSELWFSWNPKSRDNPVDKLFRSPAAAMDPDIVSVRANYTDNPWFPAVLEAERQRDRLINPQRYGHTWLGEYEPMAVGAIWSRAVIDEHRRDTLPDKLTRVVVAVDPAVSSGPGADEHGIIVAAIDPEGRGYIIDDLSCRGGPEVWSKRAVAAYDKWEADCIVVERNQGGDMVKHTIRTVRAALPVVEVVATRGKHLRAEPIAALYTLGKISHIGAYPELEGQMCQMTLAGYEGEGSPDRVDAAVYALTELFPKLTPRARLPVGMVANSSYSVFGD